jgi:predicted nucleic acid-binding protein
MSFFIDTSALYALMVRTEKDHIRVRNAFRSAADSGRRMLTTSYFVVETAALLQNRIGLAPVRDLDEKILPLLDVFFVDRVMHAAGVQRLLRTDRRRISLADAVSFELMEAEGIDDVMGLDSHFAAEGFRLLP